MATSVQLCPHPILERHPLADELCDLRRLARMILGNAIEQYNFIGDQNAIKRTGLDTYSGQRRVVVQRPSAENNALIGFGWGHGRNIVRSARGVNGRCA